MGMFPQGSLTHDWGALSIAVLDMKIAIWRALIGEEMAGKGMGIKCKLKTDEVCVVCKSVRVVRVVHFPLGSIPLGLCEKHKYHIVGWKFGPQAFENSECVVHPPCVYLEAAC